ncbi:hypothetical protein [Stackebrandtia soli]|uniref:hypothetical protein n=1 Tax=Stackebrandtia soli TaxID=1892856 RepID=UPI0039E75E15
MSSLRERPRALRRFARDLAERKAPAMRADIMRLPLEEIVDLTLILLAEVDPARLADQPATRTCQRCGRRYSPRCGTQTFCGGLCRAAATGPREHTYDASMDLP